MNCDLCDRVRYSQGYGVDGTLHEGLNTYDLQRFVGNLSQAVV